MPRGGTKYWLGKHHDDEYKQKMSAALKGRVLTEEWKKKIGLAHKGKVVSLETREKLAFAHRGLKLTEEHKKKISEGLKGRTQSEKTRKMIGEAQCGHKHHNWQGGKSFEPYCIKFNREFKERVRKFFGYMCVECNKPKDKYGLPVHHVNFNKMSCCDNTPPLFVSLCPSCHSKTNFNREYWERRFTDIINNYYGGQCYLPKGEGNGSGL